MNLFEEEKVAVIPGIHFSDNGDKYIRLNIARNRDEIELALNKIRRFCKNINLKNRC